MISQILQPGAAAHFGRFRLRSGITPVDIARPDPAIHAEVAKQWVGRSGKRTQFVIPAKAGIQYGSKEE